MKTVTKKLLCLMLALMMLVSAVPAVMAAEGEECLYFFVVHDDAGNPLGEYSNIVNVGDVITDADIEAAKSDARIAEFFAAPYQLVSVDSEKEILEAKTHRTLFIVKKVEACTHANTTETNTATCTEAGVRTVVCDDCGETVSSTNVANLGHNVVDGACTRCDYTEEVADTYVISFIYLDGTSYVRESVTVESGDALDMPTIPLVSGKDHIGWQLEGGSKIADGDTWYKGMPTTIYAIYESDTTEDDIVELTIYAYYYVDGEYHHQAKLLEKDFETTKKNTMFSWLYSDQGVNTVKSALAAQNGADGYQWATVKYYDFFDNGELTEADMKTDGPKTVYIKVNSLNEIEANVMLYIHTGKDPIVDRVIPMPGYTAGDYVTSTAVKNAIKTKYTITSKTTVSDLYDQGEWEDLMDGLAASGAKSVKVESNGTTKIHVILKNASSGSTADSTNPKTGDFITIATTGMSLSGAALVSLLELKKRKMI